MQLVFVVPSKDAPGFARRTRRALELRSLQTDNPNPEVMDKLVSFLADYVQAETREQAEALVWDASETQWAEMLDALGGARSEVPPPKSETLENP